MRTCLRPNAAPLGSRPAPATSSSRSGARLIREPVSGVEALTPSEVRVAELAAEGLTNREVAQSLFVSEKTVETHLGRVYRKLDIKSRHALPGALAERQAAAEPVA